MPIAIHFTPVQCSAAQYDEIIRRLAAAGLANPAGRLYTACYGDPAALRVVDIWESEAAFQRFGETLMPIVAAVGVDPGTPEITPVHNIIAPPAAAPTFAAV